MYYYFFFNFGVKPKCLFMLNNFDHLLLLKRFNTVVNALSVIKTTLKTIMTNILCQMFSIIH